MAPEVKDKRARSTTRQIIGFSLPPDVAADVKAEATRRRIPLKQLFGEMWTLYKRDGSSRPGR
jgi:hypothetical protein